MAAFEFLLQQMGKVLERIFMHEMMAGTGVTFLDFGVFMLIVGIVAKALINSIQVTDEGMTSSADRKNAGIRANRRFQKQRGQMNADREAFYSKHFGGDK